MTRRFAGVAELAAAAGDDLGHSEWHQVSQQDVDRFAALTGDRQWIHVDPDRAATGPFGTTIAHGYYLLSMLTVLLGEIFEITGVGMVLNTGVDAVRFIQPVPVGSAIRAAARLATVQVGRRGVARLAIDVMIFADGKPDPVCTTTVHSLVRPPLQLARAQLARAGS
ncbi:MAG TPA: MaoC family dehydratase [Mycobacteriales bacterium]|nr:MaoC family dehydratase [Mycobacteriales bacterium]